MTKAHSFHIPVMGIGFTIDTPLKISQYGIDSVIALLDDILLEKLRKTFCEKYKIPYSEITEKIEDFRAKRITSYLNLINDLAEKKFEDFKETLAEKGKDIKEYFNMLPDSAKLKQDFENLTSKYLNLDDIKVWLKDNLSMGSIDVNIMTKVDKDNYIKDEKQPVEYNDAHAALRGYAKSNLSSSIIFSAGMNPRLYNYLEKFDDFYPNKSGKIKKKIILKVSDYRSALIQGKFLAKKGLWVSEYRVESGLNCGGHAFATDGHLLGPILSEFKSNKVKLTQTVYEILVKALNKKNMLVPKGILSLKITAQGGVGTAEEHNFLLDHYGVDSVGWGTPFLLAPDVANVDDDTIGKLINAKENDLYLSDISPLSVPFNNLKGNTKDFEKFSLIKNNTPGSLCPKQYITFNNEFSEKGLCVSSRKYQSLKIKELDSKNLSSEDYKKKYDKIVEKSCLCVGLGTSSLLVNDIETKTEGGGVSICPGPNMAYFDKKTDLNEMINHIYGKTNLITRKDRPNMFIKELDLYINYLKNNIEEVKTDITEKQEKYFLGFIKNLETGIDYYYNLFGSLKNSVKDEKNKILSDLDFYKKELSTLSSNI